MQKQDAVSDIPAEQTTDDVSIIEQTQVEHNPDSQPPEEEHESPEMPMSPKPKPDKPEPKLNPWQFATIGLVVILIAVTGFTIDIYNTSKLQATDITRLTSQLATTQQNLEDLDKPIIIEEPLDPTDDDPSTSPAPEQPATPAQKYINLPALGVRMPVSDEIAAQLVVQPVNIAGYDYFHPYPSAYTLDWKSCADNYTSSFHQIYRYSTKQLKTDYDDKLRTYNLDLPYPPLSYNAIAYGDDFIAWSIGGQSPDCFSLHPLYLELRDIISTKLEPIPKN